MAEPAKPSPSVGPLDVLSDVYKNEIGSPIALLGFFAFVIILFFVLWLFSSDEAPVIVATYFSHYLGPYLATIKLISSFVIVFSTAGIIYVLMLTREIDNIEYHKYESIDVKKEEVYEHGGQWQTVLDHLSSEIPSEWRIAILEADTMLDEAIKRAGGKGDTLGERLKALDPGNFKTLQSAWDAHKIRNMIAHEGINFRLTEREAKRVIDLYEAVLTELKYI